MLMSTWNRNRGTGTRAVSCCSFDDEAKCPSARKVKRSERQKWKKTIEEK